MEPGPIAAGRPEPDLNGAPTPGLAEALSWLRHARRILVFTGAGISTESGIPDFRGPNGVWKTTDPQRYTIDSYISDRSVRVERWRARLEGRFSSAQPNAAHLAVTRLQRAGLAPVIVTQNIDGLHQKAGTVNVIELHGTSSEAMCLDCRRRMPIEVALDRVREGDEDPHCELCGGLLKTATLVTLVLPLLVLAVPVLDTSFVVAKRLRSGQPIYVADARHLHHRFMRLGYSQRRSVVYLWTWCGTLALAALATRFAPPHHHGRWSGVNVAIDAAAGLTALAFSLYVVYLLEIVKLANRRPRRRDSASEAA